MIKGEVMQKGYLDQLDWEYAQTTPIEGTVYHCPNNDRLIKIDYGIVEFIYDVPLGKDKYSCNGRLISTHIKDGTEYGFVKNTER